MKKGRSKVVNRHHKTSYDEAVYLILFRLRRPARKIVFNAKIRLAVLAKTEMQKMWRFCQPMLHIMI
jgi:hypothetical protein